MTSSSKALAEQDNASLRAQSSRAIGEAEQVCDGLSRALSARRVGSGSRAKGRNAHPRRQEGAGRRRLHFLCTLHSLFSCRAFLENIHTVFPLVFLRIISATQ